MFAGIESKSGCIWLGRECVFDVAVDDYLEFIDCFIGKDVHINIDAGTLVVFLVFWFVDADVFFVERSGGGARFGCSGRGRG